MTQSDDRVVVAQPDAARAHTGRESLTQKGIRFSGYFAWVVVTQVATIGLPRLCIFPICAHFMGAADFGKFVAALGWVSLVGLAPMKGLTNAVFREFASQPDSMRDVLIRTAYCMGAGLFSALLTVAIVVCVGIRLAGGSGYQTVVWIALFIPGIVAQNLVWLGVVDLSIARRFKARAFWRGMTGVTVGLAIPGILLFGRFGSAAGYSLGFIVVLVAMIAVRGRVLLPRPRFDRAIARHLAPIWVVLAFESMLTISSRYVHRSLLDTFRSSVDVSRLFGASNMVDLFINPLNMVSLLVTALLARHVSLKTIPVRMRVAYAIAALAGSAVFYAALRLGSALVLPIIYPEFADDSLALLPVMAPGASFAVLTFAARPFVMKFSPWRFIPILSGISFVGHLLPALILIPRNGLSGAAWSYSIGIGFTGVVWFGLFIVTLVRRTESALEDGSP